MVYCGRICRSSKCCTIRSFILLLKHFNNFVNKAIGLETLSFFFCGLRIGITLEIFHSAGIICSRHTLLNIWQIQANSASGSSSKTSFSESSTMEIHPWRSIPLNNFDRRLSGYLEKTSGQLNLRDSMLVITTTHDLSPLLEVVVHMNV